MNDARVRHGLDPLRATQRLSRYAERHARRMARAGQVFHSDLSFPKPPGWRCAGENVGTVPRSGRCISGSCGAGVIVTTSLSRRFERISLGVVRARGAIREVQVFVG